MPPAPVRPEALEALGAALGTLRDCARSGADEVLDHLPEVGDRELQTGLDDYLDQVADLLREMEASVVDVTGRLRVAAAHRARHGSTPGDVTTAPATTPSRSSTAVPLEHRTSGAPEGPP